MAIMRRIFEERCKIVKDHEAKGTQIEVCQGVDDIFRCKVTSLQNSATDLFFISGSKRLIAVQTETSFSDSTETNHKGVKKDRKTEKKNGKSSSVVHLADDILCSLSVISFSSVKMDRISSCVALPPQDDCSTEVPGDTFFPSVSLNVLSVAAIFSKLYELVTSLFFLHPFPHLLSRFVISVQAQIQHLPLDKLSISLSIAGQENRR